MINSSDNNNFPHKTNLLTKLYKGLAKSSFKINNSFKGIFKKSNIDHQAIEDIENILLQADFGISVTTDIIKVIKQENPNSIKDFLINYLTSILVKVEKPLIIDQTKKPFVIFMIGVNGSGKTTTTGKLAQHLSNNNFKVMLAAADRFRAAAIEQLVLWGKRVNCQVIANNEQKSNDPASIAFDAFQTAQQNNIDVLIIDTAGRLQNNSQLMAELVKIDKVLKKLDPQAPHSSILTLDATVGQNSLNQVEIFKKHIPINGIIVNKLDGTARGGSVIAIAEKFAIPIHYLGMGEAIDDLTNFTAKDFVNTLFAN